MVEDNVGETAAEKLDSLSIALAALSAWHEIGRSHVWNDVRYKLFGRSLSRSAHMALLQPSTTVFLRLIVQAFKPRLATCNDPRCSDETKENPRHKIGSCKCQLIAAADRFAYLVGFTAFGDTSSRI